MKKDSFDEKWKNAMINTQVRLTKDKTINGLMKRHQKLGRKMREIERKIAERRAEIFYEELKKMMKNEVS